MTTAVPRLRLLPEDRGFARELEAFLGSAWPFGLDGAIGLVRWSGATKDELAGLDDLRATHDGPIVAVIGEMPSVRGARAVMSVLEGAVLLEEAPCTLEPTLRAVAVGQCVVPASLRHLLERPPLSPRERQVLAMVTLDFSNAEIARRLVLTESSVKSHLTSAFGKLGVSSRNAAVELILDGESGLAPGIIRLSPAE
jgi:DNA-binding NarL/FixJ family response regulator